VVPHEGAGSWAARHARDPMGVRRWSLKKTPLELCCPECQLNEAGR
jgi:hypothetical protein